MAKITGDQIAGGTLTATNIATSGVTAGLYGSTTQAPQFVVGADGRITSAANATIGAGGTPGGSDKNIQYNNTGAFGGIANNTSATNKYLQQVSTGTPTWQQVTGSDLLLSDVTTNNASTAAHGFLSKLDGVTTHFLNGSGSWAVPPDTTSPPGGGDKNIQYNSGGGFAGVANNVTATNKYLQQVNTGTPTWAQVTGSDLLLSDVTTNNASVSNHGFLAKLSGLSTQYMDGSGAWSTPSSTAGGSPGGSNTAIQYNSSGAFAGVTVNTTATKKYLQQVSTGVPTYVQVADIDLSFTDVTTNNASTGSHGYLQKLDNISTHYLDGSGSWSVPPGGGGVSRSGVTTDGHLAVWNGSSVDSIKDGGAVPGGSVSSGDIMLQSQVFG